MTGAIFLWSIPYTRSTAEKKLQILQAMHIHELNWELCIDLRFVLCIGIMEMAKKKKQIIKATTTTVATMEIEINRAFL